MRPSYLDFLPDRVDVLGVPIDPWTMGQTVQAADAVIRNDGFGHMIGVNADKLLQMRDDPQMDSIVRGCEIINADGASMAMAAHFLHVDVPGRVAGIDLMCELCRLAESRGYPVYLLGAKRAVVEKTAEALRLEFPRLNICGLRDGYFGESEFETVCGDVMKSRPRITFVGITSPKKERLIECFRNSGAHGCFVGVGGSFDVISGNIPRAPKWVQDSNLEWAFRMLQEPGRLGKRYVVGNAKFIAVLAKSILRKER